MQPFEAPTFIFIAREIGRLSQVLTAINPDAPRDEATGANDKRSVTAWGRDFKKLGLDMCQSQCARIIGKISADYTNRELSTMLDELCNRMYDEVDLNYCMILSQSERKLFDPTSPHFGEDFAVKFAVNGAFEADEAAKCLALGRSTAAVFHLMRVMEVGIRAVARCLGIADPIKDADRNWGKMLDTIKDELDSRGPAPKRPWATGTSDKALFARILASLDAVRVAWRNPTMHVENKYTPDEAEHIFLTVRGFMKAIAVRCDEEGMPAA